MQRRSLLWLAALSPLALLTSRGVHAGVPPMFPPDPRLQARQLNELAAGIHTVADARRFVDGVAAVFAEEALPGFRSRAFLDRIARAEFAAVTQPEARIPEARLAKAWNAYAATIGAPAEQQVTLAELHNLRDGLASVAGHLWSRNVQTLWTVPAIYAVERDATEPGTIEASATGPDVLGLGGTLAEGCRAVEAFRLVWDLADHPEGHQAARERVRRGVLVSAELQARSRQPVQPPVTRTVVMAGMGAENPLKAAAWRYVRERGLGAFESTTMGLVDGILG